MQTKSMSPAEKKSRPFLPICISVAALTISIAATAVGIRACQLGENNWAVNSQSAADSYMFTYKTVAANSNSLALRPTNDNVVIESVYAFLPTEIREKSQVWI